MLALFLVVAGWSTVENSENWLVERRTLDHLDEVRITTHSRVTPKHAFETAWNLRDQARYAPNLKRVDILSATPDKVVAYQQVSVPMADDRDYVIEATRYTNPEARLYQIFVKSAPSGTGPAPSDGHVRMTNIHSQWTFEPDPAGGTTVTLVSYGDPGGNVPVWIVRLATTRGPSEFIRAVLKRAEETE